MEYSEGETIQLPVEAQRHGRKLVDPVLETRPPTLRIPVTVNMPLPRLLAQSTGD